MIKIISKGGNARGIKVLQDGVEIKGIIRIDINPIEALGPVTATITVPVDDLDIEAHDTLVLSGGDV